jgi:DNA-binding NtrC family response regulator
VLLGELMVHCRGNKSEMARKLGWGRQTLLRRLRDLAVVAQPE